MEIPFYSAWIFTTSWANASAAPSSDAADAVVAVLSGIESTAAPSWAILEASSSAITFDSSW